MTKPRLGVALVAAMGAVIALSAAIYLQHKHPPTRNERDAAYAAAGAFVLLGSYSVRRIANQLGHAIARADRAAASIVRLVVTIVGVIIVVLSTMALLHIDASQLLLGGAITGVALGIAAQQSLGNIFAGIVLLVAHPFRAGDHIRVRNSSLGVPFEGHVVSMGLTYVIFSTDDGTTLVPNLTILASGIVRDPKALPDAATAAAAAASAATSAATAAAASASAAAAAAAQPAAGESNPGDTGGQSPAEDGSVDPPSAPRSRRILRPS
jgi:hypothetical protein